MGDFELIESSFNNADETINFGTRSMGPVTTSLFEICTLACLKSEDELFTGVSDVQINSLMRNGHLFFATDKSLKIFQNMEMKNLIFNASFESNISFISLSSDDQFLVVCFETGVLYVFTIHGNDIQKVYSGTICENLAPQSVHSVDCCEDDDISAHFLIVFPNGLIFRLIVKTNDTGFNFTAEEMINLKCKVNTSDYSYPLLSLNGSSCHILNIETKDIIYHDAFKVKNFFSLNNMLLSLDFDGNLFRLCPLTLTNFYVEYDYLIDDMLVMNGSKSQILAVTKPNETGEIFLQLLESDFSQIFSLPINFPVYLIQMDFTKNDIVFVSKVTHEDRIKELRLQTVYETDPESRLMRLVKRRRFVEAEEFAKTFNIDPSIILKAKAQLIVDKSKCTSEDIKNLLSLMDSINDAQFNLECCTNVDCSNFHDVRQILTYGSKISPKPGDERKDDVLSMKEAMLDLLFKFDTFMALSHSGDISSWTKFSICNLLLEVKEYLKDYRIQDAIIVYSRLGATTLRSLNLQHVEDILEILNNIPTDLYEPFLPTFIPITMTNLPSALYLFGNWVLNKIYQMEKRDSANFPGNAIKMVEDIVKLIRVESKSYISFQRHCLSNKDFDHLATITEGLNTLQTLKKKFGITIHLNEYLEGPKVLTAALMKLSMASDQYDYFLKNFLYTFMLHNEIDPDTIFVEEINNLLQFSESWMVIIEVIIKHISSVELKLLTVKDILEKAPVPWCDVTRRIAQSALQLTHPLVKDIELSYNDEPRLFVLRNSKYGIKKAQNADEFNRVIHRIIYVNESHMIDDIYLFCNSEKEEIEASVILIQQLIFKGRLDEARSVLGNRIKNDIPSCITRVLSFAENVINDKCMRLEIKTHFYDMLPQLYQKLIGLTDVEFEKVQLEENCRILRGVYYFNNELGTEFVTDDFKSPWMRKTKYNELLQAVLDILDPVSITFTDILNYSEKVAYHLSKDKDEVLITLCEKYKKLDIMYQAGEHLLQNDSSSSNMCIAASLFMKYLGSHNLPEFDISRLGNDCDQTLPTFNLKFKDDSCNNDIFVNSLKLADELITQAQLKAVPSDFLKINEINDWINSCYYLTRQKSTLHDKLYENLYCPKENLPSTAVLSSLRNCYEAYVLAINKKSYTNSDYLAFFSTVNEARTEPLVYEISKLSSTIDLFCREGQHLTAFSLLRTIANSFYLQPSIEKATVKPVSTIILTRFLPQIMYAVVSAKIIDLDLLFTLLLSVRQDAMKYLMHYLQTYKRNSKKLHDLSLVGIRLLDFYQETKGKDLMVKSVKTCKWWRKLTSVHSKIMYDEFFKIDADTRLKSLIALEVVGIKEIKIYCEDYNLPVDKYYREYLRSSLVNWKPDYKIESVHGRKTIIMKHNEDELHTVCQEIIKVIGDNERKGVLKSMEIMLKEVNFYHYEVFHAIYKILQNNQLLTNYQYIVMLQFLKSYTRFQSPSQREKEEWYITFPDTQTLDPLSEYRLPFTPLLFTSDIWSILRPEISLKSYELWFHATKMLKHLKVDDICVYAVKQIGTCGILGKQQSKDWLLYSKFDDLFEEVDRCVQHISDLERATSAVYHLMNCIPDGADKVKAAMLSFKYVTAYRNKYENDTDVERAFVKVKNKYFGLSACHILHRFNLAKENYLKLVTQSHSLIEALYMDERIPKYAGTFCFEYSDINNAVDALCDLFNLDVQEIRKDLLHRCLNSSYLELDMDTYSCFMPNMSSAPKTNNDEDNLKRAIYICSSGNAEDWQSYLLGVGLNDEDEEDEGKQNKFAFKAKALKCFCAIADENTIATLTKLSYNEFLHYIDKLTLLSDLESLGIFLTVDTLQQYNKKELLKKLSSIGKPLAIKCMGALCITYFLEENLYWDYIVTSSIKLEMIEELKIYVEVLKDKRDKKLYINAWQAIIDKSFHQISNMSDESLEEVLINNFLTIQSCPVSFSLNFDKIIKTCIDLEKAEFAALLLQYMPQDKQNVVEKEIFQNPLKSSTLEKLKKKGLWGVRSVAGTRN